MGEKFKPESNDSGKTDWSRVEAQMKVKHEEERANMTPEELAEDDEKQKRYEETRKWAERSRKMEQGDPEAIADFEAEKKAFHEKLWKGAEKAKAGEEETPEKIEKAKQEIDKLYNKEGEESLDKTDQEVAEEMLDAAKEMKFEDLVSFSLEVYRKIKDKNIRQETYDKLTEIIKQKQAERLQEARRKGDEKIARHREKMERENAEGRKKLEELTQKAEQETGMSREQLNDLLNPKKEKPKGIIGKIIDWF